VADRPGPKGEKISAVTHKSAGYELKLLIIYDPSLPTDNLQAEHNNTSKTLEHDE
jgi:hypothetical protein